MIETPLYMIALRLEGRRVVVVGRGPQALDKIERMLACGAQITLIWPDAMKALRALAAESSIEWVQRSYEDGDLEGAFVAIAATDDEDVNERVSRDAQARSILVNVVDVPRLSNFIVPAITRHGPIAIAISTAGASPALAKRMRDEIAATFGAPYARLAQLLNELRDWAKETLPTYEDRRAFFEGVVRGDPDPVELLREGREDEVLALLTDAVRSAEVRR